MTRAVIELGHRADLITGFGLYLNLLETGWEINVHAFLQSMTSKAQDGTHYTVADVPVSCTGPATVRLADLSAFRSTALGWRRDRTSSYRNCSLWHKHYNRDDALKVSVK